MPPQLSPKSKISGELARILPHLRLAAEAAAVLDGCIETTEALSRLEQAGFLGEAAQLVAHALPAREAVWWACACTRHTASSSTNSEAEATIRAAAEEWVRRQTDEQRWVAMKEAEQSNFQSPEAWAALAAFWSGVSMAPPDLPRVPPQAHFPGLAVAGAVAMSAVRGSALNRETRLRTFLASAKDIASGGKGRIDVEKA